VQREPDRIHHRACVHSYTEPHICTDNEFVRDISLALLATLAKQEAKKISERTKAGLARARAQGKRLGRPSIVGREEPLSR
jgi:DNA invertase Pin-like site-specific DNA recombinase